MRLPPLGITLTLIEATTLLNVVYQVKAQQCRLQLNHGDSGSTTNPPSNHSSDSGSSMNGSSTITSGLPHSSANVSSSSPTFTPFKYGSDKIRGVNIGGWLVLEPWITPSVFQSTNNDAVVDEYTLGQLVDRNTATQLLQNHWESWITEDDFLAMYAAGINHVRIPLGYWSVPLSSTDTDTSTSVDPYIPGAWKYLLRGLNWAKKYSIHVILDIHGAPGSQNGYDNSGQQTNDPQWALNPNNITRTVDTVRFIAENLGGMVDVLELLNEAAGFRGDQWAAVVRQFWLDGYNAVRTAAGAGMKVMIGDAFLGVQSWTNFLVAPQGQGVLMDFHEYQIFSDGELDRSFQQHIDFACGYVQSLSSFSSSNIWTIVGEWSNAITDCAKWLNGRGVGARWDGTWTSDSQFHGSCANFTGSYANFSNDYKTFLRMYWEVQVEIGESIQGWVFWTWKTENADEWSYQKGLEGGWIPQDPTDRLYPGICSGS